MIGLILGIKEGICDLTYPTLSHNVDSAWDGPGKLWSLLDMLRVYAHKYVRLGRSLESLWSLLWWSKEGSRGAGPKLNEKERERATKSLQALKSHCEQLALVTSADLITKALENLPETHRELEIYINAVMCELQNRLFFYVPSHRSQYYSPAFGESLTNPFPRAHAELARAGNCLAFGEYTAAVFHAMRACEIGLRAIADDVGVAISTDIAQWNTLIEQIEAKIKEMSRLPKSSQRDADLRLFGEAAAQFRYFKDAWRNHVSHAKETYDEGQALTIFNHVRQMFEALAPKLKEAT